MLMPGFSMIFFCVFFSEMELSMSLSNIFLYNSHVVLFQIELQSEVKVITRKETLKEIHVSLFNS